MSDLSFDFEGIYVKRYLLQSFPGGTSGKEPVNAGDIRDVGFIPGLGRSLGRGYSNPFQYSCLENPMDRRAWWATVRGATKNQTPLKQLSTYLTRWYI